MYLSRTKSQHFFLNCQVDLKVPVVVRLEGTNVDQGKRILKVIIGDHMCACLFCLYLAELCFLCLKTCLTGHVAPIAGKWNDIDHCRGS